MKTKFALITVFCLFFSLNTEAQRKKKKSSTAVQTITYEDSLYNKMAWRNIGPFRGGRSTTSSGVKGDPMTYYFGSVGGGVWKTDDAGINWRNISDKFFKATSIGAIAVAESDPNVIYVGTGEACVRGVMTSHGDGLYNQPMPGKPGAILVLRKPCISQELEFIRITRMWLCRCPRLNLYPYGRSWNL